MDDKKYLTIHITIPEEYEDVHPQLILEDFIENPKEWLIFCPDKGKLDRVDPVVNVIKDC